MTGPVMFTDFDKIIQAIAAPSFARLLEYNIVPFLKESKLFCQVQQWRERVPIVARVGKSQIIPKPT